MTEIVLAVSEANYYELCVTGSRNKW